MSRTEKTNKPSVLPPAIALLASLTLGLAPFRPRPHVVEKLGLLFRGELTSGLDILDLVVHGSPWVALAVLSIRFVRRTRKRNDS